MQQKQDFVMIELAAGHKTSIALVKLATIQYKWKDKLRSYWFVTGNLSFFVKL